MAVFTFLAAWAAVAAAGWLLLELLELPFWLVISAVAGGLLSVIRRDKQEIRALQERLEILEETIRTGK